MAATTKGMFFNSFIKELSRSVGQEATVELCQSVGCDHFGTLIDYPIEQLVRLQTQAAKRFFSDQSLEESMHMFGSRAFNTFADSLFGKIALTLVRGNLQQAAPRVPTFYSSVNKFGAVDVERQTDRIFTIVFTNYRNSPHYHLGVVERALEIIKVTGSVELKVLRLQQESNGYVDTDFTLTIREA